MSELIARTIDQLIADSKTRCHVRLDGLPKGARVRFQTRNTLYTLEKRADGWYIDGNGQFCPIPVLTNPIGSTWGGSTIWLGRIAVGMHLEFTIPEHGTVTTTAIRSISVLFPDGKGYELGEESALGGATLQ